MLDVSRWVKALVILAVLAPAAAAVAQDVLRPAFSLRAANGEVVTEKTYRERWQIIFFGFTRCPDVCPTAMSVLSAALREMSSRSERLQALFVTVDPLHDTSARLSDYVARFDAPIVALTGSKAEVGAASRAFLSGPEAENASDRIAHLALFYVLSPDGRLAKVLRSDIRPARLIQELDALLLGTRQQAAEPAQGSGQIHSDANSRWQLHAPMQLLPLSVMDSTGTTRELVSMRNRAVLDRSDCQVERCF